MNTTQEKKFCAVTYDSDMTPIGYWLGTFPACERFGKRERNQDERVSMFIINEVDSKTTWEQKRDELWPADPNAKGRVIWSGTWSELKVK